jgi:hypothetical protein
MTVLPNAPIDAATGLPVPTIAVATDGGVSIIKDDGTVVDITTSIAKIIDFDPEDRVVVLFDSGADEAIYSFVIPSADQASFDPRVLRFNNSSWSASRQWGTDVFSSSSGITTKNNEVNLGVSGGLIGTVDTASATDADSNFQYLIASNYNTGWMNGDIKLATLSDTDDTNLIGGELVTNGTFDTDITGWTDGSGGTGSIAWDASSAISLSNPAGNTSNQGIAYQEITTIVGQEYRLTLTKSGGNSIIQIGTPDDTNLYYQSANNTAAQDELFVATTTTTRITLRNYTSSTPALVDDVSLTLLVKDRSVNNNGLQVFGTITKTAVATGADLVAYSGFSTSNYLEQPYNSDLDFGTGDFCKMGWVYNTSFASRQVVFRRNDIATSGDNGRDALTIETSGVFQYGINTGIPQISATCTANAWQHVAITRSSGSISIYVNGTLAGS